MAKYCLKCGALMDDTSRFCGNCGTTVAPVQPVQPPPYAIPSAPPMAAPTAAPTYPSASTEVQPSHPIQTRYRALRIIATVYKVIAFIVAGLSVIGALAVLVASESLGLRSGLGMSGPVFALIALLYGAFIFIALYGFAEFIYVFIDIEHNTRATHLWLAERAMK